MEFVSQSLALAEQYFHGGDLRLTEQLCRQVLQADPAQSKAWCLIGVTCLVQARLDEAGEYFQRALQLRPDYVEAHSNLGAVLARQGRLDDAEAHFQQAVRLKPDYAEAHSNLGAVLDLLGKPVEAMARHRQALRIRPDYPEGHNNLGLLQERAGEFSEAESSYREALRLRPDYAEAHYNLGNALLKRDQPDKALDSYRQALRIRPDYPEAHNNLGLLHERAEELAEAESSYRHALRLRPDYAEAHANLGRVLLVQEKFDQAVTRFHHALRLKPDFPEAHCNLGVAFDRLWQLPEAEASFREALHHRPGYAEAHFNLGNALHRQGKLDEAVISLEHALQIRPTYSEALSNLGVVLDKLGKSEEAEARFQQALRIQPDYADAHVNFGTMLLRVGRLQEAVACFRQALRFKPDFDSARSNLLLALNYDPEVTASALFAEHRHWQDHHVRPSAPPDAFPNHRDPNRRIRVGYVSPDLRWHPVAYFFEPILAHHDPTAIEAICYCEVETPDVVTARLSGRAHGWRLTRGWSDVQLAEAVRRDAIDILVDLAGHTAGHRLPAFVHKPAPIQVTYLGYPNTTGLDAIDYRLTDAIADPPGEEVVHTEELVRLPGTFCCYAPPARAAEVTPLPARRTGQVTFGSLHPLMRLNPAVLDLWCEVLRAVPTARLLIFRDSLVGAVRDALRQQFEKRNIATERIELGPGGKGWYDDYRSVHGSIDLALDTFPWSGHTLACESLWMGVPILTLYGVRHAGRMVASVLHGVGLQDWVARTPEEYVAKAVEWASNLDALSRLRSQLRQQILESALCDGITFTRGLEAAYRQMWQRWCADAP